MQREEIMERVCVHAATALDALGAAFFLVDHDSRSRLVAASDERTARLGQTHGGRPDTPATRACQSGRPVSVDHIPSAWPELADVCRQQGVVSVAAIPISIDGEIGGALEVYRTHAGAWSRHDLDVLDTISEIGSMLMARTSDLDRAEAMIEQLRNTLDNRAVIEQAKGMISRDHQVSVDAAFELLRRHSRNTNTPVRVLARAVTDLGMQVPDPADRPPRRRQVARTTPMADPPDFVAERT